MKKSLIVILSLTMALAVSAQRGHGARGFYNHPGVTIIGGYSPFYNPYYAPFYPYAPYAYYGHPLRPTKLDLKIEDIKNDYREKIWAVKHDAGLTRKQRRVEVRRLKHERDNAIMDAKMARYKR